MRRVCLIQTSDGELFPTEKEAQRHTDRRYGDLIGLLARDLAHKRYAEVLDFIDQHLEHFVKLQALKADLELQNPEPEDD